MKRILIFFCTFLLLSTTLYSQSLRSIKNRIENELIDRAVDELFDDSDKNDNNNQSSNDNSSRPEQKADGSGLDNSLADVPEALTQASTEFNAKEYRNARASLRKALNTLEMNIGQEIIASLPKTVSDLPVKEDADQVTSSSSAWTGLTVHREYKKNDSWAAISMYNGSLSSLANITIGSGYYTSSTSENTSEKDVRIKGYDAVISFNENQGYAVKIPLGQYTIVLVEGVNVGSEAKMIAIAESFDYAAIQKSLGDQ